MATDRTPDSARGGLTLRGTALVGIGLVSGQIFSWLLMVVATRALGPQEYGRFGSLSAILIVGSTVPNAVQVVVARHVAKGGSEAHLRTRALAFVGAIGTLAIFAGSVALATTLRIDILSEALPMSLMLIPLTVTGVQLGVIQGRESHLRLGLLYLLAGGLRSVGGMLLAVAVGSTSAVLIGMTAGALAAAIIGAFLIPHEGAAQSLDQSAESGPQLLHEVGHALHALVALFTLTNVDILVARSVLSEFDSGLYAAGALVSRAVFFLPYAVLIAAFPKMVNGATTLARRQSIVAVACLGLACAAGCFVLPNLAVTLVAGSAYADVASDLWLFALSGAGFGLLQVVLYTRLADSDRKAPYVLWAAAGVVVVLGSTVGSSSVTALVLCSIAVAWLVAGLGAALAWREVPPAVNPAELPTSSGSMQA